MNKIQCGRADWRSLQQSDLSWHSNDNLAYPAIKINLGKRGIPKLSKLKYSDFVTIDHSTGGDILWALSDRQIKISLHEQPSTSEFLGKMVRPPGFEPGTIRLKVGCSTTELRAHRPGSPAGRNIEIRDLKSIPKSSEKAIDGAHDGSGPVRGQDRQEL